MKIISGEFGGRQLKTPKNNNIRPTSDKVRGAIFNMLVSRGIIKNANVLDAFCGTGALGLEALSRGAIHCTFIDSSRTSLNLTRNNADILGVTNLCDFWLKDIFKIENNYISKTYNLIFLDPPYNKGLISLALDKLKSANLIAQDSWVVCESESNLLSNYYLESGFTINVEKIYGDIKITLLENNN